MAALLFLDGMTARLIRKTVKNVFVLLLYKCELQLLKNVEHYVFFFSKST